VRWLRTDFQLDFVDAKVTSDLRLHAMFESYFQPAWNDGTLDYSYYYDRRRFTDDEGTVWLQYWNTECLPPCYHFTTDTTLRHQKITGVWGHKAPNPGVYTGKRYDPRLFQSLREDLVLRFRKSSSATTDGALTPEGNVPKRNGAVDWQSLHRLLAQDLCEPFTQADCRSLLHELTNDASQREMDLGAAFSSGKV
jgi:hypothetical protein